MKKLLIIMIALFTISCEIEVVEDDKASGLNEFDNQPTYILFEYVAYGFVAAEDSVYLIDLSEPKDIEFDQTGRFFKVMNTNDTLIYRCDPLYNITTAKLMKQ